MPPSEHRMRRHPLARSDRRRRSTGSSCSLPCWRWAGWLTRRSSEISLSAPIPMERSSGCGMSPGWNWARNPTTRCRRSTASRVQPSFSTSPPMPMRLRWRRLQLRSLSACSSSFLTTSPMRSSSTRRISSMRRSTRLSLHWPLPSLWSWRSSTCSSRTGARPYCRPWRSPFP